MRCIHIEGLYVFRRRRHNSEINPSAIRTIVSTTDDFVVIRKTSPDPGAWSGAKRRGSLQDVNQIALRAARQKPAASHRGAHDAVGIKSIRVTGPQRINPL